MFRKQAKCYVGSWLGGFEWLIFVGVDGFAYGKTGSYCWRTGRGCVCGAMCDFVVEQVFSVAFEKAIRCCGCVVMETGHSAVVHPRLCSVQRMSPNSKCE